MFTLQARLKLKKEYDLVVSERDVLGTQVSLQGVSPSLAGRWRDGVR